MGSNESSWGLGSNLRSDRSNGSNWIRRILFDYFCFFIFYFLIIILLFLLLTPHPSPLTPFEAHTWGQILPSFSLSGNRPSSRNGEITRLSG